MLLTLSTLLNGMDDCNEQTILYHGSSVQGLEILEPRSVVRGRGRCLCATPEKVHALAYMHSDKDSIVEFVNWCGESTAYSVFSNSSRSFSEDDFYNVRGSIYEVTADGFDYFGYSELVSDKAVRPISETRYESVVKAMMESGVQVFLVGASECRELVSIANDEAYEYDFYRTLLSLQTENQKLGINPKPIVSEECLDELRRKKNRSCVPWLLNENSFEW